MNFHVRPLQILVFKESYLILVYRIPNHLGLLYAHQISRPEVPSIDSSPPLDIDMSAVRPRQSTVSAANMGSGRVFPKRKNIPQMQYPSILFNRIFLNMVYCRFLHYKWDEVSPVLEKVPPNQRKVVVH